MLILMTYLSDGCRVKGYMYVPSAARELSAERLQRYAEEYYGVTGLSVALMACRLLSAESSPKEPKLPVLLYCRGGSGSFGKVRPHWMEQFASRGHLVFAPCYRGNEGGEGRDEFGGVDQEDVASAIRFIRSLPFVDPERITVMGFSRGTINAAQAAVSPLGVKSLVLWSGVSDLVQTYRERPDLRRTLKRMVGGSPDKLPEEYKKRSPLEWADRLECPVLIIHGTEDEQVPYSQGLSMYERLRELQHEVELHRYEGLGHLFPLSVHEEAVRRMIDWMEQR